MGIVFIEELPDVVLNVRGAKLSYDSGGEAYLRMYPMDLWRAFLEREIGRLRTFDDTARKRVVPFPKGRRREH